MKVTAAKHADSWFGKFETLKGKLKSHYTIDFRLLNVCCVPGT